jgi:cytochrome c peroxidase
MAMGPLASVSILGGFTASACLGISDLAVAAELGVEIAVPRHLQNGEEYTVPLEALVAHGHLLFDASFTSQEGGGRPLTKGTGSPLADPTLPLSFPRNFNRLSAPDSNACSGCHNIPRSGGGGDIVANVFVLGQRFDFATFDDLDTIPTGGNVDEAGRPVQLQTIANSRNTLGMFGSGYIEMLARQMTAELQAIREAIAPGASAALVAKGISFGMLARAADGSWDTSGVEGLAASSLKTTGAGDPPSLLIRPFHQAGAVVSLREFTNNAYNHHHGMQSEERFGSGMDPDGDGFADELTRADITAASVFQATLAVPGRVIARDPAIEQAVRLGEELFVALGCVDCHVPELPLDDGAWVYTEPSPYNPPGNLQVGEAPELAVDLTDRRLDPPRLRVNPRTHSVLVPAFTDLKLHNITAGPDDPNREPLDMQQPAGSEAFFAGNARFLTRKLWGVANEPPYFHHGQYTTLRTAIEAHHGEAESSYAAWTGLGDDERAAVVEFLKTLQVLPAGTRHLVIDETGHPRVWRGPLLTGSP